jgi:hypothetical protein
MDVLEYIYEVVQVNPIPFHYLDNLDESFLYYILEGHSSAYQIYCLLKKEDRPLAYKNVHRRIKRLFEANLIEEIKTESGFKHGARNYKLATRGLVYFFSEFGGPDKHKFFLTYSENILFRTFLYPYLERNTIKSATYSLVRLIENYLEECCQMTTYALDIMVDYIYPPGTDITLSEIILLPPIEKLYFRLKWHIKSFLIKTAIFKDAIDWRDLLKHPSESRRFPSKEKIRCTADDRIETFSLLSGDKKFIKALEEVKGDFSEGYNKLIELKNKKNN